MIFRFEGAIAVKNSYFGALKKAIMVMSEVTCEGTEANLTLCNYTTSEISRHTCDSKRQAGVICAGKGRLI